MTCIRIEHGFLCGPGLHDLRPFGARVWMCWHRYSGPIFYRSETCIKPIDVPSKKTWVAFEKWQETRK